MKPYAFPLHSDISMNFSGGHTFPSDAIKPKFHHVGHRPQWSQATRCEESIGSVQYL